MPPQSEEVFYSSLGIKPHRSRSDYLHISGDTWLAEKAEGDGAEGLWRVHDDLYDLTDFIDKHPGGSMWLTLTKGTDITEAFESHHLSDIPNDILKKYHVRKAQTARSSPFTFHEDGFYRQLKKEIKEAMKDVPKDAAERTKRASDMLFAAYLLCAIIAGRYMSYWVGAAAGIFLGMLGVAAHNYIHQRDTFRMYYFDLTFLSSREWRISHTLSHHLFPNTIIDMQLQLFEPFMDFLPKKKSVVLKYIAWFYFPIVYFCAFIENILRRFHSLVQGHYESVGKRFLIPFAIPAIMYMFSNQGVFNVLWMFTWIVCISSSYFMFVGVNAAHQHPDVFHDGDAPRGEKIDWGISQLDALMDRNEITGSFFLVLTSFGDHGLHHLFPALDHGVLEYLYPVFDKVCKKFNVELRMTSQLELIKGTFQQMSKDKPNPYPPGYKNN